MMLLDPPVERQNQIRALPPQLAPGEMGHRLGRGPTLDQAPQHRAAGYAENVGSDARQLDVGGLQEPEEPVAFGRLALHQLAAVAQQLAQLPQRLGRYVALFDQAVPNQIGDPLGILHIGLAPRHVAHVPCVADDQLEMPFEGGVDRAPVDARALHPDVCHSRSPQPAPQRFEVPRHGAKRPHLLGRLRPRCADQKARHDRLLMHVQTTAPLDDRLHHRLLLSEGDRDAAGMFETLLHVLPVPGGDKEWYLYAARAGLPIGVVSHRSYVSLTRSPVAKAATNRPAPPPFSSIMARHRRWLAPKLGGYVARAWMRGSGRAVRVWRMFQPRLRAVATIERRAAKSRAASKVRKEPEIFILTFIMRRACSARLLVKGTEKS